MSRNTTVEEATQQEWLDFANVWGQHGLLDGFEIVVPQNKDHNFSYKLKLISLDCKVELIFDDPILVTVGNNGAAAENPYLSTVFANYKGSLFKTIRVWLSKSGDTYIIIEIELNKLNKTWSEKIFVKNPILVAITY